MLFCGIFLAANCTFLTEQTVANGKGFYERKAEGWFWYQDPPKPQEPSDDNIGQPVDSQQPLNLNATWLRENLKKYLDLAWDNPTTENVQAFLHLQKYAVEKSQHFSEVWEQTVIGDRDLDENARRPHATFAAHALDRQAETTRQELLGRLAEKFGLFFFFRSDCPQSKLQATVLQVLRRKHNFFIKPISLDGGNVDPEIFPTYNNNQGHAEKLGVRSAPAVFLVSPAGEISSIGYGAMSVEDVEHRLLVVARRQDWISAKDFYSASPVVHNSPQHQQAIPSVQVPIPPIDVLAFLGTHGH